MSVISLSTMWAQQARFDDIERFRSATARLGYDAIEVSHSTDLARLEVLTRPGPVPLSSLHAPTPRVKLADGRWNGDANLADPDDDARRIAVATTNVTIDYAARLGLKFVVVHLGGVGAAMTEWELELRRLYDSGTREGERVEDLRERCRAHRSEGAAAHLEAAHTSLQELTAHASALGVALGLENRYHYHEIPSPVEAEELLSDYSNDVAGYWHDVGHAEVQHRLGMIDRHSWFPRLTPRTLGTHLHDVDGIGDHRAPGHGDVDWSYIAAGLPKQALRVFEINQYESDDLVAQAPPFLRARGVIE
jgi:sugar phosphate isomerase/epimerase